jgi:hypothetical protein
MEDNRLYTDGVCAPVLSAALHASLQLDTATAKQAKYVDMETSGNVTWIELPFRVQISAYRPTTYGKLWEIASS